jgi:hypothetical protein
LRAVSFRPLRSSAGLNPNTSKWRFIEMYKIYSNSLLGL